MADYAGAAAAIKQRLRDLWTTTRVVEREERLENWPPVDTNGDPAPWVFIEVVVTDARQTSTGSPGSSWHNDEGWVHVQVFDEPKRTLARATQYATDIGELFRNKQFYADTPGYAVRTWTPRVSEGGASAAIEGFDAKAWAGVTMSVPFEYLHLS